MKVLGLHSGHNASSAYIEDGILKYAIQEERLTGVKNHWGFPFLSIKMIMKEFNISPDMIDIIALSSNYIRTDAPDKKKWLAGYETTNGIFNKAVKGLFKTAFYKQLSVKHRVVQRQKMCSSLGFDIAKTIFIDHHLCHASSAYYCIYNKYPDDEILILTLDGSGDGLCSTVSIGCRGVIKKISETKADHSLGNIYSIITYLLGFTPLDHEYKIMGMAPYASYTESEKIKNIFDKYLTLDELNPLIFKRLIKEDTIEILERIKKEMYRVRFDVICGGLQLFTENLITRWVKSCIKTTGIHNLALSGGVFMNVKANQKIFELKEVKNLFIIPSAGDESTAIGACFKAYSDKALSEKRKIDIMPLEGLYLGNDIYDEDVEKELKKFNFINEIKYKFHKDIEKETALLLSKGEIVARAKGRMEFGARSLGNRSILANPDNVKTIKIINEMIKNRDFWMPFCPSVTKESIKKYYVKKKEYDALYMIMTFNAKEDKIDKFIAACHPYDDTTRPQEVTEEINSDYYRLIKYFEQYTGESIILNTSFNLHGYPIVSNAQDAFRVFDITGLKYLALGNNMISKVKI